MAKKPQTEEMSTISIRIPKWLHDKLKLKAQNRSISLNAVINLLLEASLCSSENLKPDE